MTQFRPTHELTITHANGDTHTFEVMLLPRHENCTWSRAHTPASFEADDFPPWIYDTAWRGPEPDPEPVARWLPRTDAVAFEGATITARELPPPATPPPHEFTELEYQLGSMLWKMTNNATSTPLMYHSGLWMRDIRPGDVVIEVGSWNEPWPARIGVVVDVSNMPTSYPPADIDQLTLRTNDGEVRWSNCDFVRIPLTEHQQRLFRGNARKCADRCADCEREAWTADESSSDVRLVLRR